MANILIVGCGYVGIALASQLTARGHQVWGLRRHLDQLPSFIMPLQGALQELNQLTLTFSPDYIFYMPSAGRYDLQTYQEVYVEGVHQLSECIKHNQLNPVRLFYISSTSVYGQQDGSWVDETTPARPSSSEAACLLAGEEAAYQTGVPTTVVRLGGIYGPGRMHLMEVIQAGRVTYSSEPLYTNRIHQKDAAGLLLHLMTYPAVASLYLGVDCEPALKNTVIDWIKAYLNIATDLQSAPIEAPEQYIRGNKRCSNQRLLLSGYSFYYPSFREGYQAC